jgi:hypothetical protein
MTESPLMVIDNAFLSREAAGARARYHGALLIAGGRAET